MCRYAGMRYKVHYACFGCRKVFRRRYNEHYDVGRCPGCRAPMAGLGMDVRAPRRNATRQWRMLGALYAVGHAFQTCGCHGPGLVPGNRAEYRTYLMDALREYEGRLAQTLEHDVAARAHWSTRITAVRRAIAESRARSHA